MGYSDFDTFDRRSHYDDDFGIPFPVKIFMGIVISLTSFVFIYVVFNMCFYCCKGKSYQQYRRDRNHQTIIIPPPPILRSNPRK